MARERHVNVVKALHRTSTRSSCSLSTTPLLLRFHQDRILAEERLQAQEREHYSLGDRPTSRELLRRILSAAPRSDGARQHQSWTPGTNMPQSFLRHRCTSSLARHLPARLHPTR